MNQESKLCQNCKSSFTIEPEDFKFYEKIDVPPPTWCPECRLQRRLIFRNERTLYRRKCDVPDHSEELISVFSSDSRVKAYDHQFWWSDNWNPLDFGFEYDFSKPFFEQFKKLWTAVPDVALINVNSINSEYCNSCEGNKNSYLVIGGDFNENVMYSEFSMYCTDSSDLYWVSKSELNYETVDCIQCSRLFFSRYCVQCFDSAFLFNCRSSNNCFGCTNLINKSYYIFNEPHTKEEYFKKLKNFDIGDYEKLVEIKKKVEDSKIKFPRRFTHSIKTVRSTGDNLEQTKVCIDCFDIFGGAEDSKYLWLMSGGVKDSYDLDHAGLKTELGYESSTLYPGNRVHFSKFIISSHDVKYSYDCFNSSSLFGCVGLRNKSYCILNKQYTKEEYEKLVPKIIEHMNDMPYIDKKGRVYKYGEFFPPELSPFAYNETIAQEYFPLTKEEALEKGYSWKDPEPRNYQITLKTEDIPDHIRDVKDDILEQIIECAHEGKCNEQCTEAFRIIPQELQFLRKMNLPLPRLCPNCRHYQRIKQRNPLKLWARRCQCQGQEGRNQRNPHSYRNTADHPDHTKDQTCPNEFQTTYAPERPEIVYCESCYLREVV